MSLMHESFCFVFSTSFQCTLLFIGSSEQIRVKFTMYPDTYGRFLLFPSFHSHLDRSFLPPFKKNLIDVCKIGLIARYLSKSR